MMPSRGESLRGKRAVSRHCRLAEVPPHLGYPLMGWHDKQGEVVGGTSERGGCGSAVDGGRSIRVGREEGKGETRGK